LKVGNPITLAMTPDYIGPAMACPPAIDATLDGHVTVLEAFVQELLDPQAKFNLAFQGGLASRRTTRQRSRAARCFHMPVTSQNLPSIDFTPTGTRSV
jgi:hypothetical protein